MKPIEELLRDHPFFSEMSQASLDTIAGCAWNETFDPGDVIFREGADADRFYIVRQGDVSLSTRAGGRGAITIETLHDGDVVGWSWLFPPYRWHLDATAAGTARLTAFDGVCLREKCESDTGLGYELVKRFASEIVKRFEATRLQLLDVYGNRHAHR